MELEYFKEFLCARCFTDLFEKRVKKVIRANRLLDKSDVVVVGLSGFRDSAILLHVFKKIFFKAPKSKLLAVTVDDNTKGRIEFARKLCNNLEVEHFVCKSEGGVWKALESKSKSLHASKIALGTSLDDEVEQALERIFSGQKPPAGKANVIKPLRECPSEEIEEYARLNKISFIKARKKKSELRESIAGMLYCIELKQPGSKFKLLKSVDTYRKALG